MRQYLLRRAGARLLLLLCCIGPGVGRADTVASLLGNFTINQYCGLTLSGKSAAVHCVVVFSQPKHCANCTWPIPIATA